MTIPTLGYKGKLSFLRTKQSSVFFQEPRIQCRQSNKDPNAQSEAPSLNLWYLCSVSTKEKDVSNITEITAILEDSDDEANMHRKLSVVVHSMHKSHMKWSDRIFDDMCQCRDVRFLGVYRWDNIGHSSVFIWTWQYVACCRPWRNLPCAGIARWFSNSTSGALHAPVLLLPFFKSSAVSLVTEPGWLRV